MVPTYRKASTINTFHFLPFSPKQKQILTWWMPASPYKDYNGVIADGAIRSGKTITMALSFVMWAMTNFNGMNFGIAGKTIGSLRRNVVRDLKRTATGHGYIVVEKLGEKLLIVTKGSVP